MFHGPLRLLRTLEYLCLLKWELGSLVLPPQSTCCCHEFNFHMMVICTLHGCCLLGNFWVSTMLKLHFKMHHQALACSMLGVLHHGEFLIMQSCYKIICQMTVHCIWISLLSIELKKLHYWECGGKFIEYAQTIGTSFINKFLVFAIQSWFYQLQQVLGTNTASESEQSWGAVISCCLSNVC